MKKNNTVHKQFAKIFIFTLLAFNLIPGIALWFTQHVLQTRSGYRSAYRQQLQYVETLSQWLLIGGAILLTTILVLGAIAFINRKAQYISFVAGWRLLVAAFAIEVVAQGFIAVWLSYHLTAFFDNSYYPKLIFVVGLLVALGVFTVLAGMFKRIKPSNFIDGQLISRIDAPALWGRVDQLAQKLKTQAPDQIIAGIDTNFFVTQAPLMLNNTLLKGRTLFISLPLLRQLESTEADGVLAHELNHLRGGDTANSASLSPKLRQYDEYASAVYDNPATYLMYYPLALYRMIFEFALQRESRQREYMADQTAAQAVSPQAIVNSLIKIEAYANYRAQTEQQLFNQTQQHGANMGIAQRVNQGLHDYARSERFLQDMQNAHIPHPFDSHPALAERMRNVNHTVAPQDFAAIITTPPLRTWVDDIPIASHIEQALWAKYEQQFEADHELSLAYRYEPASQQEEQVVLKHFPPVTFALKNNQKVQITYQGIITPEGQTIDWDAFKKFDYTDGMTSDTLVVTHPEKKMVGHKSTRIKLPGIKKERIPFKMTMGRYWDRHQIMRAQQQAANQPPEQGNVASH